MLVADLASGIVPGVLIRMGNSVREVDVKSLAYRPSGFYDAFQADSEATAAGDHPTDLKALSVEVFDRLVRHGFEVADATLTTYAPSRFPRSLHWSGVSS